MSTPAPGASDGPVVGVSIPIPAPYGPQLQRARASYGDPLAEVIPAHITLLGPTAVEPEDMDDLEDHLTRAAATVEPFVVVLRGTGTFRPVSDVVFVQVARGIAACEQLEQAIRKARWGTELAFPYHPHVTVAHDVSELAMDRAFDELADFVATFGVRSFDLSVRDGRGAFVPTQEFVLGEAGP